MRDKWTILQSYMTTRYCRSWRSRASFERWQEQQIIRHINKVRKASRFYNQLWNGIPSSQWRSFPMIDKPLMMEHFDDLNTAGIRKDAAFELAFASEGSRDFSPSLNGVTIGLSSGTSGNRGLFLVSDLERYTWAGAMLAKVLPRSLLQREKIAFFLRADSRLYGSVQSNRIQFEFFDLLIAIEQHVSRLNGYQPTILVGPPSLLRMLAHAVQTGALSIAPVKVISVAEVLEPLDRQFIESAFRQTIHQVYQCTEGFLASTCSYGTLHFNEDIICIEKDYVDRALNKFVPVITDFSRFTQPIIRYRLNDLITERQEACPCGSTFTAIQSIDGRSDDLFYLPAMDMDLNASMNKDHGPPSLIPVFPDLISRAVIMSTDGLSEYKVIQWNDDHIEIMLQLKPDAGLDDTTRKIEASLTALFRRLGCASPRIEFSAYQPPDKGVKLRRIVRNI